MAACDSKYCTINGVIASVVYCGVLWCAVVCCGVLWCAVVYCGVLWCAVMYCDVLWCTVVYCSMLSYWMFRQEPSKKRDFPSSHYLNIS